VRSYCGRSGHQEREDNDHQSLEKTLPHWLKLSFKSNHPPHMKGCLIQSIQNRVSTILLCQGCQHLFNEISSLRRDLQLKCFPQGLIYSAINSKGSRRPDKGQNPLGPCDGRFGQVQTCRESIQHYDDLQNWTHSQVTHVHILVYSLPSLMQLCFSWLLWPFPHSVHRIGQCFPNVTNYIFTKIYPLNGICRQFAKILMSH
jgi:hypothetical protein